MDKSIVLNQVTCLECNTVLRSINRHDFKKCNCPNETSVDGGFEYSKYGGKDLEKVSALTLYSDDDHNILRDFCEWSKLDTKTNNHSFIKIKDLGDDHLKSLVNYSFMSDSYKKIIQDEINFRNQNKN